jgi:hypothetical protein
MSGKVIAIRRKNSGDSIEKASADYQKELREIIGLVESAKTRLSKMTLDMEDDNIEIGTLDEALDALDDAIDILEDSCTD